MSYSNKATAFAAVFLLAGLVAFTQQVYKGKIIDPVTKEALAGVSVHCTNTNCACGCASNSAGEFELTAKAGCCAAFMVSSVGYESATVTANQLEAVIYLRQVNTPMQSVVLSANREAIKRSLAPVAITAITSKIIQDAKALSADQLLNKVSGVYMVNLGNEQHSMSIRQPMTTKSLFLYLEDGIPIRTTGLFNHNALLEMNLAAVKNIEVIKGPSSSLYGSEAIGGVVNFITVAPPSIPTVKVMVQGSTLGYRRTDIQAGFSGKKIGVVLSGYVAARNGGYIDYSDFHKIALTARVDYRFSDASLLSNSFTMVDYNSDMTGGIDSTKFASRSFGSNYTFTYRKVNAFRYRSVFSHNWQGGGKTTASLVYRINSIGQNPAYAIKDDYRKSSNGSWTGMKNLAHGEINKASFNSYALIVQHRQNINWKKATIIGGGTIDISPSAYRAEYIRVNRDTLSKVYNAFTAPDSLLTHYKTHITNYALFSNVEISPFEKLRVVASLRYDFFVFHFNNYLAASSYSGSPDTTNNFKKLSSKIGFTYNLAQRTGFYINYSEGFIPPQVTEMYKGVKVPELKPSVFYNYELGGWSELIKGKLTIDFSVYRLQGTNEIIAVRMDDGSTENRNTGKTLHEGIEAGITATATRDISLRISAAYSRHMFDDFIEKGISYSGHEMNGAPRWMHNAEIWYRPSKVPGLRAGIEWQTVGAYYMDPLNTVKYKGYHVFHVRAGYRIKAVEAWVNVINVTNNYYAYTASRSNAGYSYTPAEPRNFVIGISYDLGTRIKK